MGIAPAHSTDNAANLLLPDAELLGQLPLEYPSGLPAPADLLDLSGRKDMHAMSLASIVRLHHPALADGIAHVLATRPEPPVEVVLARSEVTGMADLKAVGDRANSKLVSPAVRVHHAGRAVRAPGAIPEESVSLEFGVPRELAAGSGPGPAFVGSSDIDLRPVTSFDGHTHSAMLERNEDLQRRGVDLDDYDDDVISV